MTFKRLERDVATLGVVSAKFMNDGDHPLLVCCCLDDEETIAVMDLEGGRVLATTQWPHKYHTFGEQDFVSEVATTIPLRQVFVPVSMRFASLQSSVPIQLIA